MDFLGGDGALTVRVLSAFLAAAPAAYISTPADVVKTRMQQRAGVSGAEGGGEDDEMAPPPPSDRDRDAASYFETYHHGVHGPTAPGAGFGEAGGVPARVPRRVPVRDDAGPVGRGEAGGPPRARRDALRAQRVSGRAASRLAGLAASPYPSSSSGGAGEAGSSSSAAADVRAGVDRLNDLFRAHAHESNLTSFLDSTPAGQTIEELVTYRRNHPCHGGGDDDVCVELSFALDALGGPVRRIAVGHTPDATVRTACGGTLLAVDSTLGRWIRAAGNDYCPGGGAVGSGSSAAGTPAPAPAPPRSRDGAYVCPEVGGRCEGQIVRFDAGGEVSLIH